MVHAAKALQALSGAWAATVLPYDFKPLHDPLAVCNDGSQAGYYFRRGQAGTHTWLIYLAGGNWCFDKASCLERCPPASVQKDFIGDVLCSSRKYPKTLEFGGVLAPSNPNSTLAHANKAYVMYCSSDGHMGDGEAWGLQFRGARIVEAVFRDLVKHNFLGRSAGYKDLVILGGVSAGARGAMVHLEYVPQFLAKAGATEEAQVIGLLDSPLWVDIPPMLKSGFYGFRKSCRNVRKFANVTHLGEECSKAFPEQQRFKCLMGQYRMQYIKTPYMLVAALFDSFQLMNNVGEPKETQQETEMDYIVEFGQRTLGLVETLGAKGGSQPRVYFSPSCFSHARSSFPEGFSSEGVDDGTGKIVTMEEAFDVFVLYAQLRSTGDAVSLIDRCQGVACGWGCPKPVPGAAGLSQRMLPMLAFLVALAALSTSIL